MAPQAQSTEIEARFAAITNIYVGLHEPGAQMCAMEAVAFVAGERWSDHPQCACPVIGTFMRVWNDSLPDSERTKLLRPLVPKLIGTRASRAIEHRRAMLAADWLIRAHTPAWLRLAKMDKQADLLAALPEITAFAPSLVATLAAMQKDARAVWDAAGAAARDATRAAARDAAWAAAWDAAWDAARDAAWAAAWAAAGAAAWAAAGGAFTKTRRELQASAVALVERMIALTAQQ